MVGLSKSQKQQDVGVLREQFIVHGHEEQGQVCRFRVRVNGQETWLVEKDMTKPQREVLEKYRVETYPVVYYSIKNYKLKSILDIHHSPTEGEMFLVDFVGYDGPFWHYWVPKSDIKSGVKALRAAYMKKKAKDEANGNASQVNNGVSGVPSTSSTSTTSSTVDASANSTASSTASSSAGSTFKMLGDQNSKEEKKVEQKREVPHQISSGISSSATLSPQVVGRQIVQQKKTMEKEPRRENFLESSYGSQADPSTRNTASPTATSSSNPRTVLLDEMDFDDMNVLSHLKLNQTSSSFFPKKPSTIGSLNPEETVSEHRPMSTAVSEDRENVEFIRSTANNKVTEEKEENKKNKKKEEVIGAQQGPGEVSKRVLEKAVEKAERALQRQREQEDLKKWERDNRKSDTALFRTGPTARSTTTTTQSKFREEPRGPPSKMAKTGSGSKFTTFGFASSSLNGRPAPITFLPTSQAPQQVHRQGLAAPPRQTPPQRPSMLLQLLQAPKEVFKQLHGQAIERVQQQFPIPIPPPLRRPVKPVLELLVVNDAAEGIDLPSHGVDYTKWNTDETVSWMREIVRGSPRLNDILSRVIEAKMTGVIIEEFINDPRTIATKLNLSDSQLLVAKALAPLTINRQRRALYQQALVQYKVDLAQWISTHPEEQE